MMQPDGHGGTNGSVSDTEGGIPTHMSVSETKKPFQFDRNSQTKLQMFSETIYFGPNGEQIKGPPPQVQLSSQSPVQEQSTQVYPATIPGYQYLAPDQPCGRTDAHNDIDQQQVHQPTPPNYHCPVQHTVPIHQHTPNLQHTFIQQPPYHQPVPSQHHVAIHHSIAQNPPAPSQELTLIQQIIPVQHPALTQHHSQHQGLVQRYQPVLNQHPTQAFHQMPNQYQALMAQPVPSQQSMPIKQPTMLHQPTTVCQHHHIHQPRQIHLTPPNHMHAPMQQPASNPYQAPVIHPAPIHCQLPFHQDPFHPMPNQCRAPYQQAIPIQQPVLNQYHAPVPQPLMSAYPNGQSVPAPHAGCSPNHIPSEYAPTGQSSYFVPAAPHPALPQKQMWQTVHTAQQHNYEHGTEVSYEQNGQTTNNTLHMVFSPSEESYYRLNDAVYCQPTPDLNSVGIGYQNNIQPEQQNKSVGVPVRSYDEEKEIERLITSYEVIQHNPLVEQSYEGSTESRVETQSTGESASSLQVVSTSIPPTPPFSGLPGIPMGLPEIASLRYALPVPVFVHAPPHLQPHSSDIRMDIVEQCQMESGSLPGMESVFTNDKVFQSATTSKQISEQTTKTVDSFKKAEIQQEQADQPEVQAQADPTSVDMTPSPSISPVSDFDPHVDQKSMMPVAEKKNNGAPLSYSKALGLSGTRQAKASKKPDPVAMVETSSTSAPSNVRSSSTNCVSKARSSQKKESSELGDEMKIHTKYMADNDWTLVTARSKSVVKSEKVKLLKRLENTTKAHGLPRRVDQGCSSSESNKKRPFSNDSSHVLSLLEMLGKQIAPEKVLDVIDEEDTSSIESAEEDTHDRKNSFKVPVVHINEKMATSAQMVCKEKTSKPGKLSKEEQKKSGKNKQSKSIKTRTSKPHNSWNSVSLGNTIDEEEVPLVELPETEVSRTVSSDSKESDANTAENASTSSVMPMGEVTPPLDIDQSTNNVTETNQLQKKRKPQKNNKKNRTKTRIATRSPKEINSILEDDDQIPSPQNDNNTQENSDSAPSSSEPTAATNPVKLSNRERIILMKKRSGSLRFVQTVLSQYLKKGTKEIDRVCEVMAETMVLYCHALFHIRRCPLALGYRDEDVSLFPEPLTGIGKEINDYLKFRPLLHWNRLKDLDDYELFISDKQETYKDSENEMGKRLYIFYKTMDHFTFSFFFEDVYYMISLDLDKEQGRQKDEEYLAHIEEVASRQSVGEIEEEAIWPTSDELQKHTIEKIDRRYCTHLINYLGRQYANRIFYELKDATVCSQEIGMMNLGKKLTYEANTWTPHDTEEFYIEMVEALREMEQTPKVKQYQKFWKFMMELTSFIADEDVYIMNDTLKCLPTNIGHHDYLLRLWFGYGIIENL